MKNLFIVGATSAIARAALRDLVTPETRLFLVARTPARLAAVAADLRARGAAEVFESALDLNDLDAHAEVVAEARRRLGTIDLCLVAHGTLGDQAAAERDFNEAREIIATNFVSAASLLEAVAPVLIAQKSGQIVALGSPAGDRGRASNYVYGAAKAGLATYLSGLRARLHPHGVTVTHVKLGFVDTPMTASFKKGALWITPERLAPKITRAIRRRREEIYLPRFWALIMLIIRNLPEPIFKRLRI